MVSLLWCCTQFILKTAIKCSTEVTITCCHTINCLKLPEWQVCGKEFSEICTWIKQGLNIFASIIQYCCFSKHIKSCSVCLKHEFLIQYYSINTVSILSMVMIRLPDWKITVCYKELKQILEIMEREYTMLSLHKLWFLRCH